MALPGSAKAYYYLTGGTPPAVAPAAGETYGDFFSGTFTWSSNDMTLPGSMPITVYRTYRTEYKNAGGTFISGAFGPGTNLNYAMFLYSPSEVAGGTYSNVEVIAPNGAATLCNATGSTTNYTQASFSCTSNPGPLYGATIIYDSSIPGWDLTTRDGNVFGYGLGAPLQWIKDRNGNKLTISHSSGSCLNSSQCGNVSEVLSSSGRYVTFSYTNSGNPNEITQIQDNSGRTVTYAYNAYNQLSTVTDATNTTISTIYWEAKSGAQMGDVAVAEDGDDHIFELTYYGAARKYAVDEVSGPLGNYTATYNLPTSTTITDTNSNKTVYYFNSSGYVNEIAAAYGTSIQEDTYYTRDGSNRVIQTLDPYNRYTCYNYDTLGNVSALMKLDNSTCTSSTAVTTSYAYTTISPGGGACANVPSSFEVLQSVSDPLQHMQYYVPSGGFDSCGNVLTFQDADNAGQTPNSSNSWSMIYFPNGQIQRMTAPTNPNSPTPSPASFTYYPSGDLEYYVPPNGASNPSAFTYTYTTDAVGNVTEIQTPYNEQYSYQYDSDGRLTQSIAPTSPTSAVTKYGYTPDSEVNQVTDANSNITTITYPTLSTPSLTICYALNQSGKCWTYNYDGDGNLTSVADPRGLSTTYKYDALNRLIEIIYNSGSKSGYSKTTTTFTYDSGNRAYQIADSVYGTISRGFDQLNDLTSESSPSGSVSYQFDNAQRRTYMTAGAQPQTNYGYDNANNLTLVQQSGGPAAELIYYSNHNLWGVYSSNNSANTSEEDYAYDYDNNLLWIGEYNNGSPVNMSVNYQYDNDDRRIGASGPMANVVIPAAVTGNTYNAGNEMTKFNNTTSISYDANGNMTFDPINGGTLTWDERNHLASGNGNNYYYDGIGRRTSWSNGSGTYNSLYDGANEAQTTGTSGYAAYSDSLLNGLGLDQIFGIAQNGATLQSVLHDGMGSTAYMEASSGTITANYQYTPSGQTFLASGGYAGWPFLFEGRDIGTDQNYYLRNRYYDPTLDRFISPDPSGFGGGGTNLYAFAYDSPTNFTDPSGLKSGSISVGGTVIASWGMNGDPPSGSSGGSQGGSQGGGGGGGPAPASGPSVPSNTSIAGGANPSLVIPPHGQGAGGGGPVVGPHAPPGSAPGPAAFFGMARTLGFGSALAFVTGAGLIALSGPGAPATAALAVAGTLGASGLGVAAAGASAMKGSPGPTGTPSSTPPP
jgi:RHS repeat-associated protein